MAASVGADPSPSEQTRLAQLRAFVAVAEAGSIGRAADQLGTTQPPLSRLVLRLERSVGRALLHRHSRGVSVTAAGDALLPAARRVLDAVAEFDRAVAATAAGELGALRVGTTEGAAALLRESLRGFGERHADVAVRLRHAHTTAKLDLLRRGELDVAFVRNPSPVHGIVLHPLATDRLVAVVAADHPLATRPSVPLTELAPHPLLLTPREVNSAVHDAVLDSLHRAGLTPRLGPPLLTELDGLAQVAASDGWTLLSEASARAAGSSVAAVPVSGAELAVTITLAWRTHPDPLVLEFVRCADLAARAARH